MIEQRYNLDDLLLELRSHEISNIKDVKYAILEANGKLSIFKYKNPKNNYPMPIIMDSKVIDESLKNLNKIFTAGFTTKKAGEGTGEPKPENQAVQRARPPEGAGVPDASRAAGPAASGRLRVPEPDEAPGEGERPPSKLDGRADTGHRQHAQDPRRPPAQAEGPRAGHVQVRDEGGTGCHSLHRQRPRRPHDGLYAGLFPPA